jgi:hypothetical protein
MMQNEKLLKFFHMVCLDVVAAPVGITKTPTIIIKGRSTPYVGSDAFVWLAKVKQWKNNVMLNKINGEQQKYLQSINNNLSSEPDTNLLGFSSYEMGGVSDLFSFFNENIDAEIQEPLPQFYLPCDRIGQDKIFTPHRGTYKITEKDKISPQKMKELCRNTQIQRIQQDKNHRENLATFCEQYASQKN